ncbi:MAG: hypothetical protein KC560_11565 [Myxococcales bacterium]|nr:hypothetical protein [Myxococcales bacterium]
MSDRCTSSRSSAARWLALASLLALAPLPAAAVVKVYDATPPHGTPGTHFGFSTTLCPPISSSPGQVQGQHVVSDTGSGTVTATTMDVVLHQLIDFDTTSVFGPGSFVFGLSVGTWNPSVPATGTGSTSPGGTVQWGVLSGWTNSGTGFCISSPQTICTAGAQVPHGVTTNLPDANSPTYDLGTWTFDGQGDMVGTSYIYGTFNGGTANNQMLITGAYVGGGVPALPLAGAAALAVGLLVAGARQRRSSR